MYAFIWRLAQYYCMKNHGKWKMLRLERLSYEKLKTVRDSLKEQFGAGISFSKTVDLLISIKADYDETKAKENI